MTRDTKNLIRLFQTGLSLRPTKMQVELFTADLARTSHEMIEASLLEIAGAGIRDATVRDARAVVHAIYWRKLAEVSSLFPMFFVFETSFRAFSAARLALIYGAQDWWRPIHMAGHGNACGLRSPSGQPVSRTTSRIVSHILRLAKTDAALEPTSYGLLSLGTLAHVSQLIDAHWGDMVSAFHPRHRFRPAGRLTRSEFVGLFDKVRAARNDAYHHRPVSGRARLVSIMEELLDLLEVDLAQTVRHIDSSRKSTAPG